MWWDEEMFHKVRNYKKAASCGPQNLFNVAKIFESALNFVFVVL